MTARYDPVTTALTGRLIMVLLLAPVLALPAYLALLWLYRRFILRSMSARADAPETRQPEVPSPLDPPAQGTIGTVVLEREPPVAAGAPAEVLYAWAMREPWRTAAVHAVAGSCYAAVMATAFIAAGGSGSCRSASFFWPGPSPGRSS